MIDSLIRMFQKPKEENAYSLPIDSKTLVEEAMLHAIEDLPPNGLSGEQYIEQIIDKGLLRANKTTLAHTVKFLQSWKEYYLRFYIEKYDKRIENNFNYAINYVQQKLYLLT